MACSTSLSVPRVASALLNCTGRTLNQQVYDVPDIRAYSFRLAILRLGQASEELEIE